MFLLHHPHTHTAPHFRVPSPHSSISISTSGSGSGSKVAIVRARFAFGTHGTTDHTERMSTRKVSAWNHLSTLASRRNRQRRPLLAALYIVVWWITRSTAESSLEFGDGGCSRKKLANPIREKLVRRTVHDASHTPHRFSWSAELCGVYGNVLPTKVMRLWQRYSRSLLVEI